MGYSMKYRMQYSLRTFISLKNKTSTDLRVDSGHLANDGLKNRNKTSYFQYHCNKVKQNWTNQPTLFNSCFRFI